MKLEFAHTADDFIEATNSRKPWPSRGRMLFGKHGPWSRADVLYVRGVRLFFAGLFLITMASAYMAVRSYTAWLLLSAVLLWLIQATLGKALYLRTSRGVRREFARNEHYNDAAVVEVDQSGFAVLAPRWQCQVQWGAVRDFIESPNLFLLIDDTPMTFIIPKRAFPNDAEREGFRQFVTRVLGELKK